MTFIMDLSELEGTYPSFDTYHTFRRTLFDQFHESFPGLNGSVEDISERNPTGRLKPYTIWWNLKMSIDDLFLLDEEMYYDSPEEAWQKVIKPFEQIPHGELVRGRRLISGVLVSYIAYCSSLRFQSNLLASLQNGDPRQLDQLAIPKAEALDTCRLTVLCHMHELVRVWRVIPWFRQLVDAAQPEVLN